MGPIRLQTIPTNCISCLTCELACSFSHGQGFSRSRARLHVDFTWSNECKIFTCTLCGLCIKACSKGALTFHPTLGNIHLFEERCDGCKKCVEACPLNVIKYDEEEGIPLICDLCEGMPKCVEWCQERAIRTIERRTE